jgi:hypothetical protein
MDIPHYKLDSFAGVFLTGALIFFFSLFFPLRIEAISPTNFVTRSSNQLMLNGQPFRFSGANMHWLGLLDTGGGTYPTHAQIDQVFADAAAMGINVVRSHTLGISIGCSKCLFPNPAEKTINPQAWDTIDYAIQKAHQANIRLIIPFTDEYKYYHGGIHSFLDWRGLSDQNSFYTDPRVIADYHNYLQTLITHTNQYTGVVLKDDPTILAWETGNELGWSASGWGLAAHADWTIKTAEFIKSLDPNHLVADGHPSEFKTWMTTEYTSPFIDMYTNHYPASAASIAKDVAFLKPYNKVYYIGEYTWINVAGKLNGYGPAASDLTKLQNYFAVTEEKNNGVTGDLFWDMYYPGGHNDSYVFSWPGTAEYMKQAAVAIKQHISNMKKENNEGVNQACQADINKDGLVDLLDYVIFVKDFLKSSLTNPRSDINQDGIVDLTDYGILVANFLQSCQKF